MSTVIDNFRSITQNISSVCARTGRALSEISLLTVTKYAHDAQVLELLEANLIAHAGESRQQDAYKRWTDARFAPYRPKVKLHFLGQLQTNKIAKIVSLFDYIDSVDSLEKAALIARAANTLNKTQRIFAQVKLTNVTAQGGVSLDAANEFIKDLKNIQGLNLCGIMAIAPIAQHTEDLAPLFKRVKTLFDANFKDKNDTYLSLGMSQDYETAVEYGSTLPRIGSAIFEEDAQ